MKAGMSWLNPTSATINLENTKKARGDCYNDHGLSHLAVFAAELERHFKDWTTSSDPITKRPYLAIIAEHPSEAVAPWYRRLTLFNRHYLEFEVLFDGRLRMTASNQDGGEKVNCFEMIDSEPQVDPNPARTILYEFKTPEEGPKGGCYAYELIEKFLDDAHSWDEMPQPEHECHTANIAANAS